MEYRLSIEQRDVAVLRTSTAHLYNRPREANPVRNACNHIHQHRPLRLCRQGGCVGGGGQQTSSNIISHPTCESRMTGHPSLPSAGLLVHRQGKKMIKDAKVKGMLGCSHHSVVEFKNLREVSKPAESQH